MNKKIVVLLISILFIVLFLIILLLFLFKTNNEKSSQQTATQNTKSTDLAVHDFTGSTANILQNNNDFKVEYSIQANKYLVTKKTTGADQKINDWLAQNNLSTTNNNIQIIDQSNQTDSPSTTIYPSETISSSATATGESAVYENSTKALVELFSILLRIGVVENKETITDSSPSITPALGVTLSPTNIQTGGSSEESEKYVYYSQAGDEFGNYALPSGCTIRESGCGPTTVAMIAASYIDKNITPKTIVDLYKQKGYLLGCVGSKLIDAKSVLESYGLRTTDYMIYDSATIDTAAKDFKNYINSGWTIFVLSSFRDNNDGYNHFFWLTKVDDENNAWAYDPYYGRNQEPPYNENSRYPFPKYRKAFGVKK